MLDNNLINHQHKPSLPNSSINITLCCKINDPNCTYMCTRLTCLMSSNFLMCNPKSLINLKNKLTQSWSPTINRSKGARQSNRKTWQSDPIKERRSRYICSEPSFPATKGPTAHCKGTISQSPSGTAITPDTRGSLTVIVTHKCSICAKLWSVQLV